MSHTSLTGLAPSHGRSIHAGRTRTRAGGFDRGRELELLREYHRSGDPAVREELVRRLLPLARDLAKRYAYTEEPLDDLVQVASLGLLKAIDRFDPARGTSFVSYATPTIAGELKRHFRDRGWALNVPRDLQERSLAVTRCREELCGKIGRSPTVRDVAGELGWSNEKVIEATIAAADYRAVSLDSPAAADDAPESAALVDLMGAHDAHYGLVEDRDVISASWERLNELERQVVKLRLVDDLTQREIGAQVGYSQMHVSRILRRALDELAPPASPSMAA